MYEAGAAVREAFAGSVSEARLGAARALALSNSRDVNYGAAVALALAGDWAGSQVLKKHLQERFPEDTFVQFSCLPVLQSLTALHAGNPAGAIELLEAAKPYGVAVPGSFFGWFGNLYPSFVRGKALMAERRFDEAVGEFRAVLEHTGIVLVDPVAYAARLELARTLASAGDIAKAKPAYQEFLGHWSGGDADIPILKEAQRELAGLK